MKKYFSIIVVPHDDSKMRNYRVSYHLMAAFVALSVLCTITLIVFVASYGSLIVKAQRGHMLARENVQLRERNAQIDSLRTELVRMQTMSIQIKNMLGVDLSEEDSILVANLSPIVNSPVIGEVASLEAPADDEQQQLLRAVPSLWPVKGFVTRDYYATGGDKNPGYHPGMDIAAERNTPIKTSAEGVVTESGWDDTYGYFIVVDHGFGIETLYGHNTRNLVAVGDRVARGQTIAFVGNTGKSTAPHLHFEVRKNGIAVDPRNYLLN